MSLQIASDVREIQPAQTQQPAPAPEPAPVVEPTPEPQVIDEPTPSGSGSSNNKIIIIICIILVVVLVIGLIIYFATKEGYTNIEFQPFQQRNKLVKKNGKIMRQQKYSNGPTLDVDALDVQND